MQPKVSATVTLLFTDLVDSTPLLERVGDERAQRLLRAHHRLLSDAVANHGGHEVKWLGDGLMVAFPSALEALNCAIAMQKASARTIEGESLHIRVGLNAGETIRDETDYFGIPVVVARRLCDAADAGQILCARVVADLLLGHPGIELRDVGALELKGLSVPVSAYEVGYDRALPGATGHEPIVGRDDEIARVRAALAGLQAGSGGMMLVAGEPGIGKTRLLELAAEAAEGLGMAVTRGRCQDAPWVPDYLPFAEGLRGLARNEAVRSMLDESPRLAQILGRLLFDDGPAVVPDGMDEVSARDAQYRLMDAVAQVISAVAQPQPVVLILDDLHWADEGSLALLRYLARSLHRTRILIIGAYRDVEVDANSPFERALASLRREAEYRRIGLAGLDEAATARLVSELIGGAPPEESVGFIARRTDGNPFFIRETVLDLLESGYLHQDAGRWVLDHRALESALPEGVRQVVEHRIARLGEPTRQLLDAASAFEGRIVFDVAARAADLGEDDALDGIESAQRAGLVLPAEEGSGYVFAHANIRDTVYGALSPARRTRMHRRIAEAWSASPDAAAHAAEIAHHYLRSRELAGREAGVPFALAAAERAAAARSAGEAARLFRAALDLASQDDPRRPRMLARLALALGDLLDEHAIATAQEAAAGIVSTESATPAREFLADAIVAFERAGFTRDVTGRLADVGLELDPAARDACWSVFALNREQRRSESADLPGIPVDIPVLVEIDEVRASQPAPVRRRWDLGLLRVTSPEAARAEGDPAYLLFYTGEYARAAALLREEAEAAERAGWLRRAAIGHANVARALISLGRIAEAREAIHRATMLLGRLPERTDAVLEVAAAREDLRLVRGRPPRPESLQQWELYLAASNEAWAFAGVRSVLAASYAELGEADRALAHVERIVPVIDRAPLWAPNYRGVLWNTITALWFLGVTRHPVTIESSVRTKMLEPRLHHPLADARLAMARLAGLDGRIDEARKWFEQARRSTESQGARPLRSIVDYDEALALVRSGGVPSPHDDVHRLLDTANAQMQELNMDGWLERVASLRTPA